MSVADDITLDGYDSTTLAHTLGVPCVELHRSLTSTQDRAHELARSGAPTGTLVIASEQTAGRGRSGARWSSAAGDGLWLTLLVRPRNQPFLEVLTLRIGILVAAALDPFAPTSLRLKWPNDLFLGDKKVAGALVE